MNGKLSLKDKNESSCILKVNGRLKLNSVDTKLELKKTNPTVWCFNALKWNLIAQSSQVAYCSYF